MKGKPIPAELPAAEMAKLLLDLTPRRLQQLAAEGIIPKARHGSYPTIATMQGYMAMLKERAEAGDGLRGGLTNQRERLTRSKADIAELESSRLRGQMLPSNQVRAAWTALASAVVARLLAVASKVAPLLVMLKSASAAKAIVEQAINEALEDLHNAEIEGGEAAE